MVNIIALELPRQNPQLNMNKPQTMLRSGCEIEIPVMGYKDLVLMFTDITMN